MRSQSDISGFDEEGEGPVIETAALALVRQVVPEIPKKFVPLSQPDGSLLSIQQQFEALMRVLTVRREIFECVNNIHEAQDQIMILESYEEEFSQRLSVDNDKWAEIARLSAKEELSEDEETVLARMRTEVLPRHLRKRLEGQRNQQRTKMEYAIGSIGRWRLDIAAWCAVLVKNEE